jgi:hypothetical protein
VPMRYGILECPRGKVPSSAYNLQFKISFFYQDKFTSKRITIHMPHCPILDVFKTTPILSKHLKQQPLPDPLLSSL